MSGDVVEGERERVINENGPPKETSDQRKKRKKARKKPTNCFGTCIDNEQRLTRIKTRATNIKLSEEAQHTKRQRAKKSHAKCCMITFVN